ncbi:carnosine n-methyltransferase [Anaeramoeba ignava]|uniref:carnosine N-methyltransferase n=1 Tax=Anaeramoeba ignava TaxID=1746090 RepID=A0A9Q0R4U5_ANAIG|nr:carnosine n-methyltransferase [Anaeramoeba ignava]
MEIDSNDFNEKKSQSFNEISYLWQTLNSFLSYEEFSIKKIEEEEKNISGLIIKYGKHLNLKKFEEKFQKIKHAIKLNSQILHFIAEPYLMKFEIPENFTPYSNEYQVSRIRSIFRIIMRDWSEDGKIERDQSYSLIVQKLNEYFPDQQKRNEIKVLVPGCGLGRLPFEIAYNGYFCEGNDFSLQLLLTSSMIINTKVEKVNQFSIFPYLHETSNTIKNEDRLKEVKFPDIDTFQISNEKFSICGGDFIEVYRNQQNQWDCVVTCFFIDTAHVIYNYIEIIWEILKPNGIWINFGPLQYHWADLPGETSLEISYEELKEFSISLGFNFQFETFTSCSYTSCPNSMLQYTYNSSFFVCSKKY